MGIQATRSAGARQLTVGFYGTAATVLLPDVLSAYGKRFPGVRVSVHELFLGSIDDILDGRVAVAFTRLLPGQTELEVEILARESRLVALGSAHPLAGRPNPDAEAFRQVARTIADQEPYPAVAVTSAGRA